MRNKTYTILVYGTSHHMAILKSEYKNTDYFYLIYLILSDCVALMHANTLTAEIDL